MGNFFKSLFNTPVQQHHGPRSAHHRLTNGAINNSRATPFSNNQYNENEGSCFNGVCSTLKGLFKGGTRKKQKHVQRTLKRKQYRKH